METQKSKRLVTVFRVTAATLLLLAVAGMGVGFSNFRKAPATAATSNRINFQAKLMSSAGSIVPDGAYNVEFKIYSALNSSGSSQGSCTGDSSCLWAETRTAGNRVTVANGYLTVELGSVNTLPTSIDWSQDLYLGMRIGGTAVSPTWDPEMSPRLHLTAVPHAFTAGKLSGTAGSNSVSLQFAGSFGQATTITLPDPGASTATICYQTAVSCGFALSTGSANYIQNQNSIDQSANMRISGTVRANTSVLTPLLDTATGTTLDLGTTNATAINLKKNTNVTGNLDVTGTGNFGGAVTTTAGGAAGAGSQQLASNLYVQSRGENLITNGSGLLGNNYNFSAFTFDPTETYGGGGSFKINSGRMGTTTNESIPVDPSQTYVLSGWGKSGDVGGANYNPANQQTFGLALFDIDGNQIDPRNYAKVFGSTDTTLAAPLNPGDTTVTLSTTAGWHNGASATQRGFAWYGYTNSKGYTYPDYTYTRNNSDTYSSNGTLGAWNSGGISGNTITLRVPWAGPAIPSGAAIRNSAQGGTYKYITNLPFTTTMPNAWTHYSGSIGGLDVNGAQNVNQFPYGTAFVKPVFLINYHNVADNNVRWSNVSFTNLSAKNLEVATATVQGVVSTTSQTFGGNKTFQGTANSWNLLATNGTISTGIYNGTLGSFTGGIIGTSTNHALGFTTNGVSPQVVLTTSGNLGVGTLNPQARFHVGPTTDTGSVAGAVINAPYNALTGLGNNGTLYVGTTDTATQGVGGSIVFGGAYTGTANYTKYAGIQGGKENATSGNYAGYLGFYTRAHGTTPVENMRLDSTGKLGVGTTNPGYKLDVNGDVNIASGSAYKINGTNICTASGCLASSGSGNYIQNGTSQQTANLNIVSAGAGSAAAQIQAAASSTQPALVVKGGATPGTGGDLLQLQNSSSTVLSRFDADGDLIIGVANPDAGSRIEVDGTITSSMSAGAYKVYQNVIGYNSPNMNVTGALKVTLPHAWNSNMMRMTIKGYDFSTSGAWEVVISGYNFSGTSVWLNSTAEIRGSAPFNQVRLGYDGSKVVVLLGTTSTIWQYPKITVSEFATGHTGSAANWANGWAMGMITSETGITNVVTPTIPMYATTNNLLGIGTTSPGYKLDVNGDVNIASGSSYRINGTTVCSASGCTPASGSNSYIQNQFSGVQSTSAYWISGSGRADTSLLTPLLDTATATTLNIGTTNATGINLNQNTTIASGKSLSVNGTATIYATGGSVGAFRIQNASSQNVLRVDTTNNAVILGQANLAGELIITDGGASGNALYIRTTGLQTLGANRVLTLDAGNLSTNRTLTLPNASGTICLQGSSDCQFAPSTGSANYIQSQNSVDQNANLRISGTARANTAIQTPLLDTPGATALNIGTTNASSINLHKPTNITGNTGVTGNLSTTGTASFGGAASTTAGGAAGSGTQLLATNAYVQSRGENLVTNGSGLLGNNYNFSGLTFDAAETFSGGGSFRINVQQQSRLNDELIPVDPMQSYVLSGYGKSGDTNGANFNPANRQYLGLMMADIDGSNIDPSTYAKSAGSTDTTLAAPLNPGDTTVTLTNATGWYNGASATQRQFIWYGYTNSKGYTYPDYTYSRTMSGLYSSNSTLGTWSQGGVSGNTITLRVPWAGPALPAGAAIRNNQYGGTFKYLAASNAIVPNTWTQYSGTIGGLDVDGTQATNLFPYGTAYVKILFLVNYHGAADNNIRWSNISLTNLSAKNLEAATATVQGVVTTGTQTFGGNKTIQGSTNAWNLLASNTTISTGIYNGTIGGFTGGVIGTSSAHALGFTTGGVAPQLVLATNGNFGVGNINPGSLLTVGSSSQFTVSSAGAVTAAGLIQGSAGLQITAGNVMLHASSATNSSASGVNQVWLRMPKGTAGVFIGDNDNVSGYTINESSGNIRFNGAGVQWGDFGYYPQGGGNGNMGHFRFSTTASGIDTTPDAKVGVGSLYAGTSIGVGTANPFGLLSVGSSSQFSVDATGAVTAAGINAGGAVSGVTTLTSSGAINGQTISSAANFTGTVQAATSVTAPTINATTGVQTAGTTRLNSSGALINITSLSASGNIATSGGALQVNGTGNSYIMGALGLGVTNPQGALTIANSAWITGQATNGSIINMMQVNANNEIQLGATLAVDGGIVLPTNGGQMTLVDLPIDATAVAGAAQSYTMRVGSSNVFTVYGEADGAGNLQNGRVAIGSGITPGYTLDVAGDANLSSGSSFRIGGVAICTSAGCTPTGGGNYIQNQNASAQTSANMWVDGTVRADTALQAPLLDTATASALHIGTSNATAIMLNKNTTVTGNLNIGYTAGINTFTIQDAGGAFVSVNPNDSKFFIGNAGMCGGRFCVANNVITGGSTYTNMYNNTTMNVALASTIIGQDIYLTDTSSGVANTLRGIRIDMTGTTNTAATLQGILVRIPTTTSGSTYGGNIIQLQNGSTNLFKITNTGATTFRNTANLAKAFEVVDATGGIVLNADTTNRRLGVATDAPDQALTVNGGVSIRDADTATKQFRFSTNGTTLGLEAAGADMVMSGWSGANFSGTQTTWLTGNAANRRLTVGGGSASATPTILVLDSKNDSSADPSGVNGAMYYNTVSKGFRCYEEGAWRFCNDPRSLAWGYNIQEDFLTTDFSTSVGNTTSSSGWNQFLNGTGASIQQSDSSYMRPGQISLDTGSTNAGKAAIFMGTGSGGTENVISLGGGEVIEFAAKLPVLSTSTQEYTVRLGLCDEDNTDCYNGVYFEYNRAVSSNWQIAIAAGGGRTKTTTSYAVNTDWTRFKIVINYNASQIDYYINDTHVGTQNDPVTMPIGETDPTGPMFQITKDVGGSVRELIVDYFNMTNSYLDPR